MKVILIASIVLLSSVTVDGGDPGWVQVAKGDSVFTANYYGVQHLKSKATNLLNQALKQFFGNGDSNAFLFKRIGNNKAAIIVPEETDDNTNVHKVKSEGQSYGMFIAAQLKKRSMFDRLWRFARDNMQHSNGLFRWRVNDNGTPSRILKKGGRREVLGHGYDDGSAPDGEIWFAAALLVAANNGWNCDGRNCGKEAGKITSAALKHLVNNRYNLIMFSPGLEQNGQGFTDPSYLVPAFFDLFAQIPWLGSGADRKKWARIRDTARGYLPEVCHPDTGLFSDYSKYATNYKVSGRLWWPAKYQYNPNGERSAHDSFRTTMNIAMDQAWNQQGYGDSCIKKRLNFYKSKGMHSYKEIYEWWGGNGIGGARGQGLQAMNAVASLDYSDRDLKKAFLVDFLNNNQLYNEYYSSILTTLSLLQLNGKWVIPRF